MYTLGIDVYLTLFRDLDMFFPEIRLRLSVVILLENEEENAS
jgi:hypothetical protein